MYAQVGDFRVSRGPPTAPLTQILLNASQNLCKAGTLCNVESEIQIFNCYYCKQHTPWLIGAKLKLTLTATAWLEKNENTGSDIIGYWIKCMHLKGLEL